MGVKLYIGRHAQAEDGPQLDPTRKLTKTGKRQAKMMGKWFKRQAEKPELVIESNFKRSHQTAKRIAKKLDCPITRSGAIDPDGTPEVAWQAIKDIAAKSNAKYVLAITHGPLVEKLLSHLTGSPLPQQFHFAHGAIAHMETTNGSRGILHWLVTPNVVARDEDENDIVTSEALELVEASIALVEAVLEEEDGTLRESAVHSA